MSSHASAPTSSAPSGSVTPLAATASPIAAVLSASTSSKTASNSPRLSPNWWYSAPRVTPAARTIASVPTSPKPCSVNSGRAAAISAARVARGAVGLRAAVDFHTVCL